VWHLPLMAFVSAKDARPDSAPDSGVATLSAFLAVRISADFTKPASKAYSRLYWIASSPASQRSPKTRPVRATVAQDRFSGPSS
jgi:hypothetical protein